MKNRIKNNIIFWSVIGLLLSISVIGLTYAFFSTRMIGNTNEESVKITAGKLELTYNDGNNTVKAENMKPDTTVDSKTFSVKNTGTNDINNYGVYIEDVINELVYTTDLDYTLKCKEYNEKNEYVKDCASNSGDFPVTDMNLVTNSIKVGYIHEYELIVKYIESNKNQSIDMNKKISGKVQIYDLNDIVDISGKVSNFESGDYITLSSTGKTYKILEDGSFILPTLGPDFHTISIVSSNGTTWETKFEIIKNTTPSIDKSNYIITINNSSNNVTMNLTKDEEQKLTLDIISIN